MTLRILYFRVLSLISKCTIGVLSVENSFFNVQYNVINSVKLSGVVYFGNIKVYPIIFHVFRYTNREIILN